MNWDEKAEDYASAHHTLEHNRYAHNIERWKLFVAGARWQRDQLLTDEAVERVAEALWLDTVRLAQIGEPAWEDERDEIKSQWRKLARTAITAQLSEQEHVRDRRVL